MNPPKDPTQPERSICGAKFREMLKCVEQTGATAACTQKINDFLACERLVFRTALSKQPPTPPDTRTVTPQARPTKPKSVDSEIPSPGAMLGRVVDKQVSACSSLADSVRRPEFRVGFLSFSRRMVADIRVTCDTLCVKLGKVATELRDWFRSDGD